MTEYNTNYNFQPTSRAPLVHSKSKSCLLLILLPYTYNILYTEYTTAWYGCRPIEVSTGWVRGRANAASYWIAKRIRMQLESVYRAFANKATFIAYLQSQFLHCIGNGVHASHTSAISHFQSDDFDDFPTLFCDPFKLFQRTFSCVPFSIFLLFFVLWMHLQIRQAVKIRGVLSLIN